MSTYLTVAIPYVNSVPHLGYAYELIEADLAARARRSLGDEVRFLGGTDDHSLKNVLAAEAAGEPTERFVRRHADRFAALATTLSISFDDFIHTSADPRHAPAVERLWRRCRENGDLYTREYVGLYCVGCEQFYAESELDGGRCVEHGTPVERVAERNWFFRLSRYGPRLLELVEQGDLLVEPDPFRNEVVELIRGGLDDISVSRSVARARGWGLPVPDDPTQVVYVWFDALTSYISALGYGADDHLYDKWWRTSDERIHVVGKGITRFHCVYWPAFLLSAGEPLPTRVHVHPYLTVGGGKISKSSATALSCDEVVERCGAEAIRWWVARDVSPTADTSFSTDRLVAVANEDLANGFGNAVSRIAHLAAKRGVDLSGAASNDAHVAGLLARFDRRAAASTVRDRVAALNRDIESSAPWGLTDQGRIDTVLKGFALRLRELASSIEPILPELAARARSALDGAGQQVFARLDDSPVRPPVSPTLDSVQIPV